MDKYFDEEPPAKDQAPEQAAPPEEETEPTAPEDSEETADQTFVLPKAIAGSQSLSVGDEITVKIVADHDDSYEVQAVGGEEESAEETETPEAPESEMMGSMMD